MRTLPLSHRTLPEELCSPSTSYSIPDIRRCSARRSRHVCRVAKEDFAMWRGEDPTVRLPVGVVPNSRTQATTRLTPEMVVERLYNARHQKAADTFGAFYSSELGGIVTDDSLMFIHMDDHMVHRGHGVFETAALVDGYIYELPKHLGRLKQSALAAGVPLPTSDKDVLRIILDTAAASKKLNGQVKFWLTAGRGGFGLSPAECTEPGFYAMVTSEEVDIDRLAGWQAALSPVPHKHPYFAKIKSNNYLNNVLAQVEAQERGFNTAFFVDGDGYVLEAPTANIGIITHDRKLVVPPFDACIAGITMQRIMELVGELDEPDNLLADSVEQRPVHVDELLQAREVFVSSTTTLVVPVTHVDEKPIGDGTVGKSALALYAALVNDMKPVEGSGRHMEVPYGYLTGMRSQLI